MIFRFPGSFECGTVTAMTDFDIHALDSLVPGSDEANTAFDRYRGSFLDMFRASPEGRACAPKHGPAGLWAGCLLDFGFNYAGATLPNMTISDLEEIVSGYFPRKVSIRTPEEAEDIAPELIGFWRFLGREFALDTAEEAVRYLDEIQPSIVKMMNDPSRFGMAKSFFMAGQAAGFDMTDQDQMNMFLAAYNARVAAKAGDSPAASARKPELVAGDRRVKHNQARKLRKKISKKNTRKKRR